MTLRELAERRNEMREKMQSIIGEMDIPYSLARHWVETERAYQIKMANIEASKQSKIIKQLSNEIRDLKMWIR